MPLPGTGAPRCVFTCPGRGAFDAGNNPDSSLVKGTLPTTGPSVSTCSDGVLVKGPAPRLQPNSSRGPDPVPNPCSSSNSCLNPGLGSDIFLDSGSDPGTVSKTGSDSCSDTRSRLGWGTGWCRGLGSGSEPGVEALMLGAAVWQDRQGTTVKNDESPRERPLQPPPRHRAAAFPMELADRSAAEPGGGGKREAEAWGGAGGAVTSARRGRARVPLLPVRPAPSSSAGWTWTLVPPLRRQLPAPGLALGRRPGNACGARARRAGDAEGTARFEPPSLPAPQPVPGAVGTMMNAEPAGSQRSSVRGPRAGAPRL